MEVRFEHSATLLPATERHNRMIVADSSCDVAIIGGGFYGCSIASYLARQGLHITLIEREQELLQRASFKNQARLHNGYHYPRSYRTALRSQVNLKIFREIFPETVFDRFRSLYAIAEFGSNVSAEHFKRICRQIGVPIQIAPKEDQAMFDRRLVQQVFEVDEPVFNAKKLRERMKADLAGLPIEVIIGCAATNIAMHEDARIDVQLENNRRLRAAWVLNCTYADLAHIPHDFRDTQQFGLVHHIAEVALVRPPPELAEIGITIMDGPFFSAMPFPPLGVHSLTHVRYTHHARWHEGDANPWSVAGSTPTQVLERYLAMKDGQRKASKFAYMMRDARRFVPGVDCIEHIDSLFEIKTLLAHTQVNDARPILFQRNKINPQFVSILGGKIDNIFDVFTFLDRTFELSTSL